MNPYQKYRQQDETAPWTRMDLLLALYDKALERLNRAEVALRGNDASTAIPELAKTQLIVNALASGVRVEVNPQVNTNILRLYEFATTELSRGQVEGIAKARQILSTLREGFEAIRAEANELERTGKIPPLEQMQMVHATA